MASGKGHAKVTLYTAIVPLMVGVLFTGAWGVIAGAGALAGVLISPDLDMDRFTYSHSRVQRISDNWCIGQAFKGIWRVFWMPYASLVPYHRHWISHAPIVGTFIRLSYIYVLTAAFCIVGHKLIIHPAFWLFAAGLAWSDFMHWIWDFGF